MKKAPLFLVKQQFGTKEKLVEAVRSLASNDLWIDRANDDKGLDCVSNAKLLRLHALLTDVKSRFGSRERLVEAILAQQKRTRDEGYKTRLLRQSLPRLFDLWSVGERAAAHAS